MTTTLNAATSGGGGLIQTADSSGILALQTGGTTAMTINGSQNVSIGTSSPVSGRKLTVDSSGSDSAVRINAPTGYSAYLELTENSSLSNAQYWQIGKTPTTHALQFWNGTEKMRLDSNGNVFVGTTSSTIGAKLTVVANSSNACGIQIYGRASDGIGSMYFTDNAGANNRGSIQADASFLYMISPAGGLNFQANNTEKARITSGGYFKASDTGTYAGAASAYHELLSSATRCFQFRTTAASGTLDNYIEFSGQAPNNTSSIFFACNDSSASRFAIRSNGGIANYSANNVNLSDRREKTNFAPAKSYLDVICAIPVQTYNYIDQNMEEDDGLTLGVVAQDVQEVAPELVTESNWGTKDEPKMRLSIYQTDMQYALMKCIQEQQDIITTLTERISALEAK